MESTTNIAAYKFLKRMAELKASADTLGQSIMLTKDSVSLVNGRLRENVEAQRKLNAHLSTTGKLRAPKAQRHLTLVRSDV